MFGFGKTSSEKLAASLFANTNESITTSYQAVSGEEITSLDLAKNLTASGAIDVSGSGVNSYEN